METQTIHVTLTLSSRAAAELADAGNAAGAVEEAVELWARRYDGWKPSSPYRRHAVIALCALALVSNLALGARFERWTAGAREARVALLEGQRAVLERLASAHPDPGSEYIDHVDH